MKKLYIKQKVFSIGESFTVTDENERPCYFVEGSFFKLPKHFLIYDDHQHEIGKITKKTLALLPKFFVEVDGNEMITLKKELTFLKSRYTISAQEIEIQGNWWDMDFTVFAQGKNMAEITKRWFSWGDTYELTILDESMERLVLSLVIAIDCVKADEAAANSGGS
ncbi:LURP-one-related family protein [Tetragenococcus halophilus]|uniref:LURP-one-related/scramblase family protein n=1 Tax=Tetragenococcus halophilus TaxID=51669 RepID=UPI001F402038|nr:LURP-one-related family protein [Tetragenococcus halophilus]MCF1685358.1 LURP-one-related family protein [Tetragenococcus halophilus]